MGKRVRWLWLAVIVFPFAGMAAEVSEDSTMQVDVPPAAEIIPRHSLLQDRFRFIAGGFYPTSTTTARLDGNTGLGFEINFEDSLGLEDKKLIAETSMRWRFAEPWQLNINYFSIKRSATRTLSQNVEWGDNSFTIGTEVDSLLKISDLRAAVGYSFFRRTDKELGLGLGLHTTGLKASIEASGIGGETVDVSAPLPVLVIYSNMALTDAWAMSTRIDWLSLSYDNYDGDIRAVTMDFIYQPFRHIGFGVGWHSLTIDLGLEKSDWRGYARLAFQGPAAFMSVSF